MDSKARQKFWRDKQKEKGMIQINVWIHKDNKEEVLKAIRFAELYMEKENDILQE